eukprot:NODE_4827_length_446_cov_65.788413_g4170_i0.p1 GENE.NODE_4827_length_446_cov_65.788413_g4170_i0~~NODE_4827_length_446_cov_65.788413_g4170_i0.p1  ORF type:complete len:98 (+),score=21.31 NODE_4827_length_446_cov_65.788413_g4170_i0:68-361(+)
MRATQLLRMSHEHPWIFLNRVTGQWGPCGWRPTWKAKSQGLNYIPENMVAPHTNGDWIRNLWNAARTADAGGCTALGTPVGQGDWAKVSLAAPLSKQ